MNKFIRCIGCVALAQVLVVQALAEEKPQVMVTMPALVETDEKQWVKEEALFAETRTAESPWMLVPTFSREEFYPGIGIGVQFLFKEAEMMVITVDYAKGEGDNSGFYMRFGHAF